MSSISERAVAARPPRETGTGRKPVFIARAKVGKMSRSLLNIVKRSLLRLMLSGVGLASKDAVGRVFVPECFQSGT
jgi:hypothetical protein